MGHSGLTIQLKLAHAPLCNFDFSSIKEEQVIQHILKRGMLHVVAQRDKLTFDNITANKTDAIMNFDIKITSRTICLPVYCPCIRRKY